MADLEWKTVAGSEYGTRNGWEGVRLDIKTPYVPNDDEKWELKKLAEQAANLIQAGAARQDPARAVAKQANRDNILKLFGDQAIFVRELPNEYCSKWCCEHIPWFSVTTKIGPIKIGWRKRVLNIDWSDSTVATPAEILFPREDVTKSGRSIHAWSYDKATEYLRTIMSVPSLLEKGTIVKLIEAKYRNPIGSIARIIRTDVENYSYRLEFLANDDQYTVAANTVELSE